MNDKSNSLSFGYNAGLPEGVRAAWGARLIVTQDGSTDMLYDRQGNFGDNAALHTWLNGGALKTALAKTSELLKSYTMRTRESEEFVLFEDELGTIVGNTNASYGYLYIAAWLKADVPDELHYTKGIGSGATHRRVKP